MIYFKDYLYINIMPNYICELCGKQFKIRSDLTRHENRKKTCNMEIKGLYQCNICGYNTYNTSDNYTF